MFDNEHKDPFFSDLSRRDVSLLLKSFSNQDTNFKKVVSSMCTVPHPVAVSAHMKFICSNLGDPGLFAGSSRIEAHVVSKMAEILNHKNPQRAPGHMTSGGTESNIEAVFNMIRSKNVKNSLSAPNIIVPKTAHFSFKKASALLNVSLKTAEVDENFCVDPNSVNSLIDSDTVGLIGIAGSTEFGSIDPISSLSEIARKHKLPLHVDAAFGGFVLPFLSSPFPPFDFLLRGVSSVSVDAHKMGLSTIPSGIIIYRDKSYCSQLSVPTPYLTKPYQSTITGTRPGASAAATFAVLNFLGRSGYTKNVCSCMDLTRYFIKKVQTIGLSPVVLPQMNIVAVQMSSHEEVSRVRFEMERQYGWHISATRLVPALRFVIMPHVSKEDIDILIHDLKNVLAVKTEEF